MAETLVSPGVLARENDRSQITAQPIQAGAAILGPTVKGKKNTPTLVTTYSQYKALFGSKFESGSEATGIKKIVDTVNKATGKDCGCGKRKEALNKAFPYKKKAKQLIEKYSK